MLDRIAQAFFELSYKVRILEGTGEQFQDFFSTIMELAHPGDFQRTRPWGRDGDQKNDGYLRSDRMLFALYAPNELNQADAIRKIRSDFGGAVEHWENYFDKWGFVHNAYELGPRVLKTFLDLGTEFEHIQFHKWGPPEIRRKLLTLPPRDISLVLGPLPTEREQAALDFSDISTVIEGISLKEIDPELDVRPVPPGKLEYNKLSPEVQGLLALGMTKADVVGHYFESYYPNPQIGDQIADTLGNTYDTWRGWGADPDTIFRHLQEALHWSPQSHPKTQVASLAVLAHFFESCDIFERPPEEETA